MDADLSGSWRCFFEKIPKGRGYLYACQNVVQKEVQKKGAILYLKCVVDHCDDSAKLNEDVFTLGVSDAHFLLRLLDYGIDYTVHYRAISYKRYKLAQKLL